jgi:hypothetical protein
VYRVTVDKNCHPERSKTVSEANRLAESKDPELAGAFAGCGRCSHRAFDDLSFMVRTPGRFVAMSRDTGSFDYASSFELASLRMTG